HPPPPPLHPLSLHDALPIYSSTRPALPCTAGTRPNSTALPSVSAPSSHSTGPSSAISAVRGKYDAPQPSGFRWPGWASASCVTRSEEHTSELQSRFDLVCRL